MMRLKKQKGTQYGLGAIPLGGTRYEGDPTDIETVDPRLLDIEGQPRMDEETPSRPMTVAPDPTMQPQMQNPTSETPRPMTVQPMSDAQRRLNELNNRDYSIQKNQPLYNVQGEVIGTQTIKGKDRDATHNWKDILRSVSLGALQGLGSGGLGGAIGGAIAGGVRGAVDRNFDNKMQDEMFIRPQLERQVGRERMDEQYRMDRERQQAQTDAMVIRPYQDQQKIDLQSRGLDIKEGIANYNKLKDAEKSLVGRIMKRGYYREGDNAAEDAELARLNIVMSDFDSRKRDIKKQAGQFYERDPRTGQWTPTQGMGADQSEVPVEFSIGGQRMMLRPRDVANIEAANQRQATQNEFTAGENAKTRAFQERKQQIEMDFRRERDNFDAIQKELQSATTAQQKAEAQARLEASRMRILEFQQQLETAMLDYNKP